MRTALIVTILLAQAAGTAVGQDSVIAIPSEPTLPRAAIRQLPRDVAGDVIRFFNAPGTVRFSGATRIPAARGIDGDVAVLGGPVTLGGRISGALTVINGDLVFEPGAVVDDDVLVVGGTIEGAAHAEVAGEIRSYRDPLRYRREADTLAYAPQRDLAPWRRRRWHEGEGSRTGLILALGGMYSRVEGVPVMFGPRADLRLSDGVRLQADARAILRTAEDFSLETGRFGYRARGELVLGSRSRNLGLGLRAYDVVSSVEPWPLKDFEAGWAALLFHDDYRDWYRRAGWSAYAALRPTRRLTLTAERREERHRSTPAKDVFSIFDNSADWRDNTAISDGRYVTYALGARIDTRNDRSEPTAGVLVSADVETSRGTDITGVVDPTLVCIQAPCVPPSLADGRLTYQRGFVDARTYLRLSPAGRLNLRLVGGGKLGGEDLPLQSRMSLGFPDPLPGWAFRQFSCGGENFTGRPALCDRAIVAQAEFRSHLGLDFGPEWANDWGDEEGEQYEPFHVSGPDVVVFADAGRAWSVGNDPGEIPADRLPSLRSYRTDIGFGLDFGPLGLYLAKSIGPGNQPVTFGVRLGRRF